jgi:hypothetical protein
MLVANCIGEPAAALTIDQTNDVAAGMAAFGPSTPLMTWSHLFPAGTTWGGFGPTAAFGTQTAIDPATGTVANSPPNGIPNGINNLYVANWIDGLGFNLPGGSAGPELAIDGQENFKLSFTSPVRRIAFTVATGQGNLPGQFDHLGAVFELTTNTGDKGQLALLDPGNGLALWVVVQSALPFTSLTFFEPSGNIEDQYFGNFVSGPAPVPLPSSLVLQLTGLALLGFLGGRIPARPAA